MQEKLCIRCGEVETMERVLLIFDWYNAGQCPYVLFNVSGETTLGSISQYKGWLVSVSKSILGLVESTPSKLGLRSRQEKVCSTLIIHATIMEHFLGLSALTENSSNIGEVDAAVGFQICF